MVSDGECCIKKALANRNRRATCGDRPSPSVVPRPLHPLPLFTARGESSLVLRQPTREEKGDPEVSLHSAIERIVMEIPSYGYRRVTYALQQAGWTTNQMLVMRKECLFCQ